MSKFVDIIAFNTAEEVWYIAVYEINVIITFCSRVECIIHGDYFDHLAIKIALTNIHIKSSNCVLGVSSANNKLNDDMFKFVSQRLLWGQGDRVQCSPSKAHVN